MSILIVKTDGSCMPNPGDMGIGVVIYKGYKIERCSCQTDLNPKTNMIRGSRGCQKCGGSGYIENRIIEEAISQFIGHGTNNEAEYIAFIRGLEEVKKIKRPGDQVKIFIDSLLVYKQTRGDWKVKKQELKPLCERAKKLIEEIEDIEIIWDSREENRIADKLARGAVELKRINERDKP